MRWLAYCRQSGKWAALERERKTRLPGGGVQTWSVLRVLDEIQDDDIHTGREGVNTVIQRAIKRHQEAWVERVLRDHRELAPLPSWAHELPPGMRILRTPAELVREGQEMNHCVGKFVSAVELGRCHILAISTEQGRSTVELTPDLRIYQHRGPEDDDPPQRNVTLLRAFLARVIRKQQSLSKTGKN